jgi:hypothetical protein
MSESTGVCCILVAKQQVIFREAAGDSAEFQQWTVTMKGHVTNYNNKKNFSYVTVS